MASEEFYPLIKWAIAIAIGLIVGFSIYYVFKNHIFPGIDLIPSLNDSAKLFGVLMK